MNRSFWTRCITSRFYSENQGVWIMRVRSKAVRGPDFQFTGTGVKAPGNSSEFCCCSKSTERAMFAKP
jgi:hypothetical protein